MALEPGGLLAWIVVGAIAGWLAGQVMSRGGYGLLTDIVVGLIGAFVGGLLLLLLILAPRPVCLAASSWPSSVQWSLSRYCVHLTLGQDVESRKGRDNVRHSDQFLITWFDRKRWWRRAWRYRWRDFGDPRHRGDRLVLRQPSHHDARGRTVEQQSNDQNQQPVESEGSEHLGIVDSGDPGLGGAGSGHASHF
jgi:uncharacterized membrane protein YeaQ/YmgE (transglycosylase-associated protein family)